MAWEILVDQRIEVRHYCWNAGASQIGINTVRYRVGSITPGGPVDAQLFAEAYSTQVAPLYKAVLDSSANYSGVSCQDFPGRFNVPVWATNGAGAGLVDGNDAPSQASGLITFRTARAGRVGRGRIYVPFPSVTSNGTDGLPVAGYMTDLQALATYFESPVPITVGATSIVLWSIVSNAAGALPNYDIINAYAVKKWATQRRRGSYGRKNELPPELA